MRATDEAQPGNPYGVVIVASQQAFRVGVRAALGASFDLYEAASTPDAHALASAHGAAVILVDADLDGALDEIPAWVRGGIAVVVVCEQASEAIVRGVFERGATGLLSKRMTAEQLRDGVSSAARGEPAVTPDVLRRLLEGFGSREFGPRGADGGVVRLTAREQQIGRMLRDGYSTQRIADEIGIAAGTVRRHIAKIEAKLGVSTRVAAAALLDR